MSCGDTADSHRRATENLDERVHQRTRLGILTLLAEVERADFSYLKATLGLTDGNLGRHLEVLKVEGLIEMRRDESGPRKRTWILISRSGAQALRAQIEAMRVIVRQFDTAQRP